MNWYTNIPFYTRTWLTSTVILTFLGRFGFVNPDYLALFFDPIAYKFQIWRPITGLFFYPTTPSTGFHFIINCYLLCRYSQQLETSIIFAGHPGDYFSMLLFSWVCCVVIALCIDLPYLMDLMVFSVLHVWCHFNKHATVTSIFGRRLKAKYLPWILTILKDIIKGGSTLALLGIWVGHLSFLFLCLKQKI